MKAHIQRLRIDGPFETRHISGINRSLNSPDNIDDTKLPSTIPTNMATVHSM
ncbi:hypothetical protein MBAV_000622 [Candidatus Magnetobacterium bavaricum]|uniref:Uncharacterized protein n=1 Tax=Candidatus Magnetobacterium bavaricum TaxID=29290 RepID=A0A0F3GZ67_9BACT|nr:hypothetical protein MBAV_000622 [Candidatus Magnetobacterium bavaricum]